MYQIAKKYGLSVAELKTMNGLTSDALSIGQKLLVKKNDMAMDSYTVKAGDTLYQIANMYNTTVDEIKRLNNLTSNILSIGQVLKVPGKTIKDNTIIYTVVKGDNLYQIANKYNVSVNEIRELNNLATDLLSIGQKLLIPN